MAVNWGNVITAAVPALVSAGAGILQSGAQEDQYQQQQADALALQKEQNYLDLRLAALKAQYAGSGGGGAGGAPDHTKHHLNNALRQTHVQAVGQQGELEQSAISNLIAAIQNGYSLAARG